MASIIYLARTRLILDCLYEICNIYKVKEYREKDDLGYQYGCRETVKCRLERKRIVKRVRFSHLVGLKEKFHHLKHILNRGKQIIVDRIGACDISQNH